MTYAGFELGIPDNIWREIPNYNAVYLNNIAVLQDIHNRLSIGSCFSLWLVSPNEYTETSEEVSVDLFEYFKSWSNNFTELITFIQNKKINACLDWDRACQKFA